jgi:hypothetical protein
VLWAFDAFSTAVSTEWLEVLGKAIRSELPRYWN